MLLHGSIFSILMHFGIIPVADLMTDSVWTRFWSHIPSISLASPRKYSVFTSSSVNQFVTHWCCTFTPAVQYVADYEKQLSLW